MRAEGRPSGVAVASVIASGSGTPAATAPSYHRANWSWPQGPRRRAPPNASAGR